MDAILIVIDSDVELARARALVDQLWDSDDPADIARLALSTILGLRVLARTNPDRELLTGVVRPFFVLLRTQ